MTDALLALGGSLPVAAAQPCSRPHGSQLQAFLRKPGRGCLSPGMARCLHVARGQRPGLSVVTHTLQLRVHYRPGPGEAGGRALNPVAQGPVCGSCGVPLGPSRCHRRSSLWGVPLGWVRARAVPPPAPAWGCTAGAARGAAQLGFLSSSLTFSCRSKWHLSSRTWVQELSNKGDSWPCAAPCAREMPGVCQ